MLNRLKHVILSTGIIKKEMRPLFKLLLQHRLSVVAILAASMIVSLLDAVGVSLLVPILEGIKGQNTTSMMPFPINLVSALFVGMDIMLRVRIVAVLMVINVVLKGMFKYVNGMAGMLMQVEIVKEYRQLSFAQLLRLGMGHINRQKPGEVQTSVAQFPAQVGAMVLHVAMFFPQFFTVGVYLWLLLLLSWKLTLTAMVMLSAVSLVFNRLVTYTEKISSLTTNSYIRLNNFLLESFSGIKVTHLFNREKDAHSKFVEAADEVKENETNLNKAKYIFPLALEIVAIASLASIMIVGSFVMGGFGPASLDVLLLFIYVLLRLIPQMQQLNQVRIDIASDMPFIRKVLAFLDPSDKLYIENGTINFLGLKNGIALNKVNFSYVLDEAVILQNMSIFIPKGHTVGVVGPSGAGKSTITEILLRFYDPEGGSIQIDGVDLRELDIISWRKHVGVVTQETFLFNDTIRNNILYAKPDASQDEIELAARRAHAHEFICQMPKGYDTILGERGVLLSGGQRQRIAIARAIVSEPEILIFDEATSSLDTESEKIVQQALDEIGKGRTVITIAHRLSTVSDADEIFVIEAGTVVENGKHHELLKKDGLYKKLVRMQSLETAKNV